MDENQLIQIYINLYKAKDFTALVEYQGKIHKKQNEVMQYLTDTTTEEIFYGGAAGGAKSFTLAFWLLMNSLAYPETRWFVARKELKLIRQSTLPTIAKLCKTLKINPPYSINFQDNILKFKNSSEIYLLDCHTEPSDPMFERFGSTEFTGGAFEEGGQIHALAYEVLKSRCGRQMNDEYGLIPKVLTTANPTKNWSYRIFYKPWKEGNLEKTKAYIPAFVSDNPWAENYKKQLEAITDKVTRQRLLEGNWDYSESDLKLMDYNAIISIFTNKVQKTGRKYIVVDVARFGRDLTNIYTFDGWVVTDIESIDKSDLTYIVQRIESKRSQFGVMQKSVLVDESGVGGGVVDFGGYLGFVSNASPIAKEEGWITYSGQKQQGANYINLKSQCYYMLAEKVNKGEILIEAFVDEKQKERIIEDLDSIERDKVDKDGKMAIISKDKQKALLGRSPDDGDVLMMRAYFDLNPTVDYSNFAL